MVDVLKMFPFATDAPKWVLSFLFDNFNIMKIEDIIKYFNAGGDNDIEEDADFEHLDQTH